MENKFSHILLVDDDDIANFLNESLLKKMDLANQIDVSFDGHEALRFIEENWTNTQLEIKNPESKLILLDINMPLVDGFGFLEGFEKMEESHRVPIVLLTTSINKKDLNKAESFKVINYIEKPLNEEKVKALVSQIHAIRLKELE